MISPLNISKANITWLLMFLFHKFKGTQFMVDNQFTKESITTSAKSHALSELIPTYLAEIKAEYEVDDHI